MTTVERLKAAITGLETLKAASAPGVWTMSVDRYGDAELLHGGDNPIMYPGDYASSNASIDKENARLIVTLHRTIDAQLAILRADLAFIESESGPLHEFEPSTAVLALADAILGGVE